MLSENDQWLNPCFVLEIMSRQMQTVCTSAEDSRLSHRHLSFIVMHARAWTEHIHRVVLVFVQAFGSALTSHDGHDRSLTSQFLLMMSSTAAHAV